MRLTQPPPRSFQAILLGTALIFNATCAQAQVVVHGELVYTMAGQPIENGAVIVQDGKIAAIGQASQINVPDAMEVLHAKVVTPGLIDARCTVGVSGILNYDHDQDQLESSEPIQPELRALDAYNGARRARRLGTEFWYHDNPHRTRPRRVDLWPNAGHQDDGQHCRASRAGRRTRRGRLPSLQRTQGRYRITRHARQDGCHAPRGADPGSRVSDQADCGRSQRRLGTSCASTAFGSPGMGPAGRASPANHRASCPGHQQCVAGWPTSSKFRLWLDGGAESYLLIDEIRAAGVPVIIHPTMARPLGELENASFETAGKLAAAGIPLAMQGGYEPYVPKTRVVLFEAALAAAHGLPRDKALAAITIDAARLLGVDQRVGSLEIGKDGDLALYDGDPFEYTTHCTGVVIDGKVVSTIRR